MLRIWVFSGLLLLFSCQKETTDSYYPDIFEIPRGFPAMVVLSDNEYTEARWTLGKRLFFDPSLSADGKISCASCHHPGKAFSDTVAVSPGSGGNLGTRNSPTLTNVGYHPYFMREGGVPTLEMQVLVPVEEHAEFNHHILKISEKLAADAEYQKLAIKAYNREISPFVITRAIANFERTIISGNSPYDQYHYHGKTLALSKEAEAGMALFFSNKTNCSVCHAGFNFTDYSFQNNGLYETYTDPGRARLTGKPSDIALFKVPTLRNVAVTGPYMHDGSINHLSDVIEHYNTGGKNHVHKSPLIRPLGLTTLEKKQLTRFLESLTDTHFLNNRHFKN